MLAVVDSFCKRRMRRISRMNVVSLVVVSVVNFGHNVKFLLFKILHSLRTKSKSIFSIFLRFEFVGELETQLVV